MDDEFFREGGEFPELPGFFWAETKTKNHEWKFKEETKMYECGRCNRKIELNLIHSTNEFEDCNEIITDDILES